LLLKKQRLDLSEEFVNKASNNIAEIFLSHVDLSKIKFAHVYIPETKLKEVNTWPIINYIRQRYPKIKVAYAPFDRAAGSINNVWLTTDKKLKEFVPKGFQFELILVPCLGFDSLGYRIGYGSGFYDKFLAGQSSALIVGLCYEFGHIDNLTHEKHDIPIKFIVTEKRIYKSDNLCNSYA